MAATTFGERLKEHARDKHTRNGSYYFIRVLSADEIIAHCRSRLAHFKAPKAVEFGPLPKTSTGKVQKYLLREREWKGREKRIN